MRDVEFEQDMLQDIEAALIRIVMMIIGPRFRKTPDRTPQPACIDMGDSIWCSNIKLPLHLP
jgi:hypothetical protein